MTSLSSTVLLLSCLLFALANGQDSSTTGAGTSSPVSTLLSTSTISMTTTTALFSSPLSSQLLESTTSVILPSTPASSSATSMTSSSGPSSSVAASTSTVMAVPSSSSTSTSTSTTSASASTSFAMASSSTAASPASSSSSQAASAAAATTTVTKTAFVPVYNNQNVAEYARVVAAVCGGCGLLLLTMIFFITVSLLLRHSVRNERRKGSKPGKTMGGVANAGFYSGPGEQSHQALFSNLSGTNIVGGYSDIQLDAKDGRGVYMNRGFDSSAELDVSGAGGYRPIEIKSSQQPKHSVA